MYTFMWVCENWVLLIYGWLLIHRSGIPPEVKNTIQKTLEEEGKQPTKRPTEGANQSSGSGTPANGSIPT